MQDENILVRGYLWCMKQPHRLETDHRAPESNSFFLLVDTLDKFPRIGHTEKLLRARHIQSISLTYPPIFTDPIGINILYGDQQPSTGI